KTHHFYPDRGVAFVSMSRPSRPRLRNHAALEACYATSSRKPVIGRLERGARASTPSTSVPSSASVCKCAKARGAWKARLVLHFLFVLCLQLVAERGLFRSCFELISRVELPTAFVVKSMTDHVFVLIVIAFSLEHFLFTLKGFQCRD
ncbi:hypothetical protein F5148DRAFT_1163365, partial [Russula earlei]